MLLFGKKPCFEHKKEVLLHINLPLITKSQIQPMILKNASIFRVNIERIMFTLRVQVLLQYALTIILYLDILAILDCHCMLRFQIVKIVVFDQHVLPIFVLIVDVVITLIQIKTILFIFCFLLHHFLRLKQLDYFGQQIEVHICLFKKLIVSFNVKVFFMILTHFFHDA